MAKNIGATIKSRQLAKNTRIRSFLFERNTVSSVNRRQSNDNDIHIKYNFIESREDAIILNTRNHEVFRV
jgi:hypothetical protein